MFNPTHESIAAQITVIFVIEVVDIDEPTLFIIHYIMISVCVTKHDPKSLYIE